MRKTLVIVLDAPRITGRREQAEYCTGSMISIRRRRYGYAGARAW